MFHRKKGKPNGFQKTWGWLNDDRYFRANYPFKRKHWQKSKTEIAENRFRKKPRSMFNCKHSRSTALSEEDQAHLICLWRDRIQQWENSRNYGEGKKKHSQGKQDVLAYFWRHRREANLYWGPLSRWQREKQRRLIWSALIKSRAADFLWALVPTVQHGSAIRAGAANRGRNIKSLQAALTQWELATLRY